MSKITIENYSFNLQDNGYEVEYWEDDEAKSCFVSLNEIKDQVCESSGLVDVSIISPYTQEIVAEAYQTFDEYFGADFNGKEAENILSLIISKKEACHA